MIQLFLIYYETVHAEAMSAGGFACSGQTGKDMNTEDSALALVSKLDSLPGSSIPTRSTSTSTWPSCQSLCLASESDMKVREG